MNYNNIVTTWNVSIYLVVIATGMSQRTIQEVRVVLVPIWVLCDSNYSTHCIQR